MGLFWHTSNLARHVYRMLGRPVTALADPLADDQQVADAVREAANEHAKLLKKRREVNGGRAALKGSGLYQVPFGSQEIGDWRQRFLTDLWRLQGGEAE